MKKARNWFMESYLAVIILVVFAFIFFMSVRNPDVDFARKVFNGLAEGKDSVQGLIDWPRFKVMGQDVAEKYSKMVDDRERYFFRKSFIVNFSLSFQNAGGDFKNFLNWRTYSSDKLNAVVAADTVTAARNSVLFTISKKQGQQKLVSIEQLKK